jgi:Glycosyl hydrolase catalytic core
MPTQRKALARLAAALVLAGALAALLLGGLLSQSSGKFTDFATGSSGRPSADWASHCAHVSGGPPPKHHTSLILGLNSVWNDDCNLAAVAGAGVTMERVELSWATVEPKPGRWNFGEFDRAFANAARHGITMLPLLMDVPSWAGPAANAFPTKTAAYADYVARAVARYGKHGSFWRAHRKIPARPVTWFEIWNEPYLSQFSASGVNPGAYARLFKQAAIAGRAADKSARFLIQADLYGTRKDGSSTDWVGPMFSAVSDLGRYFDGVAVHPYTSTDSPSSYDPSDPRGSFRRIENIRQQFAARGAGSKPFWITEVGWSTCPANPDQCVSDSKQAAYLATVFDIVKSDYSSWVKAVFPYNYRDGNEDNEADKEVWFGLIRRQGQPKPAWNVLRAAARA